MAKEKFCSPEDISVVIPYRDFEKLVKFASEYEQFNARLSQQEKQLDALRVMYGQALDRIAEINKYL